ncbi:hypothetical protein HHK36_011161 [Tetracentron sinense]|uniref:Uncharacterized protein n=1 Tax=Tetracentron sinense TaxID=13715 RepID=A0A835DJN0_TETSI|nr:hypothetical protein HHK36_011161 [Tetracentron sinense]
MSSFVTIEELKLYHSIDRELYARLVLKLRRDAGESMQVIALWLWLEEAGYDNLVKKMLPLPDALVNALADESVTCLACIETGQIQYLPDNYDIPLIHSLMQKDISLQFFTENRANAIRGVTKFVNDVCTRAFNDIVLQASEISGQRMGSGVIPRGEGSSASKSGRHAMAQPSFFQPLVHPGYSLPFFSGQIGSPSHLVSGGANVSEVPVSIDSRGTANYQLTLGAEISEEVPQENRTIFLTFSKGYPISEGEVMEFFTRKYGDCIETIYMQEVAANAQALFARLVIRQASTIAVILNGKDKKKFVIDGKHVWARRYVPKRH